ncbi:MAG: YfhO family protein [Gammaproteobacteria bacterium]|nr:YfhO family protein [Gammaproteobacteria bacterium]
MLNTQYYRSLTKQELLLAAILYMASTYLLWCVLEHWLRLDMWGNYDNRHYHADMIGYGMQRLLAGEWPHWNPHQSAGLPFFAALQGMFLYPTTWFALVVNADTAHVFGKITHLAVSGFATYFYLRILRLHPLAAFLGGLFFMTGNFYLVFTVFEAGGYPLATLGILLGATEKILQSSARPRDALANRWSVVFIITMTFQVFAGYIQSVVFIGYFLCLYIPFRIAQTTLSDGDKPRALFTFGRFGCMAVLTLMLSAIQLLPTLEMSTNSSTHNLSEGMDISYVNLPWIPSPSVRETLNDPIVPMTQSLRDMLFWALVALGLLFCRGQRALVAFYIFASVLFLTMARGTDAWLYQYYFNYFPTGNWFRWPQKFLMVSNFTLSVLVALGLHHCHQRLRQSGPRFAPHAMWSYCFGIFVIAFLARYTTVGVQIEYPNWEWKPFGKDYSNYTPQKAWDGARHLAANPAAFRMHLATPYTEAEGAFNFLREKSEYERTIALLMISLDYMPDLPVKWAMREGLYSIEDYEPLNSLRFVQFTEKMGLVPFYHKYAPRMRDMSYLFSTRWLLVSQNWLNRSYGGLRQPFRAVYADEHFRVFELPGAIPRSYVATDIVALPENEVLDYLSRSDFDPSREVVVSQAVVPRGAQAAPITAAKIVEYRPEHVVIDLPANAATGLLVLTDSYYPNWQASVDGEPAEIIPVNHLFRGVQIEPGDRQVVFSYQPLSFYWGAGFSLIALAFLLIFPRVVRQTRS